MESRALDAAGSPWSLSNSHFILAFFDEFPISFFGICTVIQTWKVLGFLEYPNLAMDGGKIPQRG